METSAELKVPQHVAIIMDGNGRWAHRHGLPRIEGHKAGAESVRRVLEACSELGVHYLTLYAFSTENWQRPQIEVRDLMRLLRSFLESHLPDLQRHDIRLNAVGRLERLPQAVRQVLQRVMNATRDNASGVLTLALSYGARDEIVEACRQLASEVRSGRMTCEDITEATFAQNLFTCHLPDPDLIIRTSGELRLSNFLLWQASYAELWVTETYWPDFGKEEFRRAIEDYGRRARRFGGLGNA